jgi:hypothetical protein
VLPIFYRELKKITTFATIIDENTEGMCAAGILPRVEKTLQHFPQSPTTIPMASVPSIFYRELQKNYNPCHNHRRVS